MSDPLTPEERAFWNKRVGLPGEGLMARDFRRLLDQVASLTAERDQACARLSQARGLVLEFATNMGPGFFDSYPTLVKLRAALAIGAEPSSSEEHRA